MTKSGDTRVLIKMYMPYILFLIIFSVSVIYNSIGIKKANSGNYVEFNEALTLFITNFIRLWLLFYFVGTRKMLYIAIWFVSLVVTVLMMTQTGNPMSLHLADFVMVLIFVLLMVIEFRRRP